MDIRYNYKYLRSDGSYLIVHEECDFYGSDAYLITSASSSGFQAKGYAFSDAVHNFIKEWEVDRVKAQFEADLLDVIGIKKRDKEHVFEKPKAKFGWKRDHFNQQSGYSPSQISRKGSTGRIFGLPVHTGKRAGSKI